MEPSIERGSTGWVVKILSPNGVPQELHCATEEMARRMASSLARATRGTSRPTPATSSGSSI